MEANKNNEIWNLQNKLERMTVEKIEAEKRIVSKDEEIIRLKNKIKEGSSVETSTLPDMPYVSICRKFSIFKFSPEAVLLKYCILLGWIF